jgi:hypothetical protein
VGSGIEQRTAGHGHRYDAADDATGPPSGCPW